MPHPVVIQGGMGVAVSGWPPARTVSRLGQARVFTDPIASPTGFPFKAALLQDTLSNPAADVLRLLLPPSGSQDSSNTYGA
jgi:hypothetical protein